MTSKETALTRLIMLGVGKIPTIKLFRNNTGQAWQGSDKKFITEGGRRKLILYDPRPIDAGLCDGSSDLIGWTEIEITPEMVGKKVAVFTAVEVKSEIGRVSATQFNFLTVIRKMGGISGIARTPDEAKRLLSAGLKKE
jgi:hypothetical protein